MLQAILHLQWSSRDWITIQEINKQNEYSTTVTYKDANVYPNTRVVNKGEP